MTQSDRSMSDFNLDKTVIIIHHYNTRSCYRNKRTKALSRLETMVPVLLRKVLLFLGDEVYENWQPLFGNFWHDRAGV